MNQLEAALADIAGFLEGRGVPYVVVGGWANLKWGRPRLTQDVDFTVSVADSGLESFVGALAREFTVLPQDPLSFALEQRVIPLQTRNGVRGDLIVAGMPLEEEAIERGVSIPISTRSVRVCTAEDLVLMKSVSRRPRDREDIEAVLARQAQTLDLDYLRPRLQELADALEQPDVVDFVRSQLKRHGRTM